MSANSNQVVVALPEPAERREGVTVWRGGTWVVESWHRDGLITVTAGGYGVAVDDAYGAEIAAAILAACIQL